MRLHEFCQNCITPIIHSCLCSVETVFKLVRQGVAGASGRAQVPFVSNGLIGDFYFNNTAAAPAVTIASADS